jgi:hypothetical protein
MKKILLASAVLAVLAACVTVTALAQPPVGEPRPDGPPPRGERGGPDGPPRPPHPVMDVLDANKDREISAEELANATVALKTLDKNNDGKLSDDEIRPPRPEGGPPGGPGRPDGPPDGDPRHGEERASDGRRPPRDGEGRPGRDGEGRPLEGRPPRESEGRGPRDGEGRPPEGRGEGPPGRPMGPPNPERFVEEAMRFDIDADGKLSKEELVRFSVEMGRRRGRPPGPDGARGPGRPDGDRPREGRGEGERPQRPPVE